MKINLFTNLFKKVQLGLFKELGFKTCSNFNVKSNKKLVPNFHSLITVTILC